MENNTILSGMKAISEYCRSINMASAPDTILALIRDESFPARKLGGIWESEKILIQAWRIKRLTETPLPPEPPPTTPEKPAQVKPTQGKSAK